MKNLVILSIALLCLFYSLVGWQAGHPQVSSPYYAYYIEKSSGLSPVEQARVRPVTIGKTYSHQDATIGYAWWSAPEAEHRWSDGGSAEIVFSLEDASPGKAPSSALIKLRTLNRQRVKWRLNDSSCEEAVLQGETEWRIPLGSKHLRAGTNTLVFFFPDAKRPGGDDLRQLAVALKSLRFDQGSWNGL